MNLSIFGAQPLQPLSDEFAESADQAEAAGGGARRAAPGSVSDVRTDADAIGVELEALAGELEALRDGVPAHPVPIRGLVALLLAYLTLPAVAALIAGRRRRRAQRAADEAPPA